MVKGQVLRVLLRIGDPMRCQVPAARINAAWTRARGRFFVEEAIIGHLRLKLHMRCTQQRRRQLSGHTRSMACSSPGAPSLVMIKDTRRPLRTKSCRKESVVAFPVAQNQQQQHTLLRAGCRACARARRGLRGIEAVPEGLAGPALGRPRILPTALR